MLAAVHDGAIWMFYCRHEVEQDVALSFFWSGGFCLVACGAEKISDPSAKATHFPHVLYLFPVRDCFAAQPVSLCLCEQSYSLSNLQS